MNKQEKIIEYIKQNPGSSFHEVLQGVEMMISHYSLSLILHKLIKSSTIKATKLEQNSLSKRFINKYYAI